MFHKLKRLLFLATFIPRKIKQQIYKYYNRRLFSLAEVDYGRRMDVGTKISLKKYKGAEFVIGDDFVFTSGDSINPISRNIRGCIFVNNNAQLHIGNDVGISSACIWCDESITIGNHVRIGGDCVILDTDCHSLSYLDRRQIESDRKGTRTKPVRIGGCPVIGDNCFIGAGAKIFGDIHIGNNVTVAPNAVVVKDVPDNTIVGGVPARFLK